VTDPALLKHTTQIEELEGCMKAIGSLNCVSCNAIHATAYAQMRKVLSMFNNVRMYNGIEKRKSVKGK